MTKSIVVPDLGVDQAEVIELLVPAGTAVKKEQAIAVLESDKASLELPAPEDGVITAWAMKVGQTVKAGDAMLSLSASAAEAPAPAPEPAPAVAPVEQAAISTANESLVEPTSTQSRASEAVSVPDLGVDEAEVIELLVPVGATVQAEQPIAVLESDKASLELPAPKAGVIESWAVAVGQKVRAGQPLMVVTTQLSSAAPAPVSAPAPAAQLAAPSKPAPTAVTSAAPAVTVPTAFASEVPCHAGPAVRKLARELGADLAKVAGSGPRGRIVKDDVHAWVKAQLSQAVRPMAASGGIGLNMDLPPEPDYSKWGAITAQPRSRIQRKSAENLARAALIVPQVTQFDLADISELEAFRLSLRDSFKKEGISLTMTVLVAKAVAYLLREMPVFNSSLSRDGESLIVKNYVNLGIAVDTPNGLLVPVLHNADLMSLSEMSRKLGELSEQARTGKLPPAAMQGATFSISSLGGVGGTAFTPLVNWPEVGILGLSKATQQPVWDGQQFVPRLMLPLSLSYDHRVIDGAVAARFTSRLGVLLADIRRLLV